MLNEAISSSPITVTVGSELAPSSRTQSVWRCAPVALFVYNRLDHTRRTVDALRSNDLAPQTDLFIFADAPKNESVVASVEGVRRYIRSVSGFRSVTCVDRERNLGLSQSIIEGITRLCDEYGRVIAVEDDIVTAPDFLSFINCALDKYAEESKIFSVSGFSLPISVPPSYQYDAFCSYRFMCWGWGTWRDRWQKADWSLSDYVEFSGNGELQERFNRGGEDLSWLLGRHFSGRIDSWDTVWAYTHSRHNALALLSARSRAYNIGFDGSGVHCRRAPFHQTSLAVPASIDYRFPDCLVADPHFAAAIYRLHHRSLARKFARYLYDRLISL